MDVPSTRAGMDTNAIGMAKPETIWSAQSFADGQPTYNATAPAASPAPRPRRATPTGMPVVASRWLSRTVVGPSRTSIPRTNTADPERWASTGPGASPSITHGCPEEIAVGQRRSPRDVFNTISKRASPSGTSNRRLPGRGASGGGGGTVGSLETGPELSDGFASMGAALCAPAWPATRTKAPSVAWNVTPAFRAI